MSSWFGIFYIFKQLDEQVYRGKRVDRKSIASWGAEDESKWSWVIVSEVLNECFSPAKETTWKILSLA